MWGNLTLFQRTKSIEKSIEKRPIFTQLIDKSFLIDPPTTNNAIYRDSLTLIKNSPYKTVWWTLTTSCYKKLIDS